MKVPGVQKPERVVSKGEHINCWRYEEEGELEERGSEEDRRWI